MGKFWAGRCVEPEVNKPDVNFLGVVFFYAPNPQKPGKWGWEVDRARIAPNTIHRGTRLLATCRVSTLFAPRLLLGPPLDVFAKKCKARKSRLGASTAHPPAPGAPPPSPLAPLPSAPPGLPKPGTMVRTHLRPQPRLLHKATNINLSGFAQGQ